MTAAPAPSAAEQAVIDRFGIFDAVTCTHEGRREHLWKPGEGCPDAIPAGSWAVRSGAVIAALEPPR